MKRYLVYVALFGAAVVINSCGPSKPGEETHVECVPYDLQIDANDSQLTIAFRNNCNQLTSGYNIYVGEEELGRKYGGTELPSSVKPHNFAVFPGDTNPDDGIDYYIADGLSNGTRYFVSVRSVFADRSLSSPSIEIPVVVTPRGELTISIRYKGKQDGFSFENNKYVRADDDLNDLYFTSKNGKDYLGSPTRLDGFLRKSLLKIRPVRGEFERVAKELEQDGIGEGTDRIQVREGEWVSIETADKYVALCRISGFSGGGEARQIHLTYLYSARDSAPFF